MVNALNDVHGSRARMIVLMFGLVAILLVLVGCTDALIDPNPIPAGKVIIDVRTAEEFDDGHLDGARLLDLNNGELAAALPDLPQDVEYLVYCKSGNRSEKAVTLMKTIGFQNVTDLGSMQDASRTTGVPIVVD